MWSYALSFYVTKTVLVGPKWFWSDQIDLDLTLMFLSRPIWNGQDQNELVRSKFSSLCLVLLCDQNSFGWSKIVLVTTKLNWSGPNRDFLPKWITFGPDQFILVVTISFWSWPNHYGQVQINLVRPKPFWTNQNCFGHIEGQGITL